MYLLAFSPNVVTIAVSMKYNSKFSVDTKHQYTQAQTHMIAEIAFKYLTFTYIVDKFDTKIRSK